MEGTKPEPTLPTGPLKATQEVAPPPDFQEAMACLQKDPLLVTACKAPPEPLWLGLAIEPAVAMMCASCIVQDEATGMTYMDTVSTYKGWVALRGSSLVTQAPKTHHRGHHQPPLKDRLMTTFGQKDRLMTAFGQKEGLMTILGQKGRLMTAFGQMDCDTIWQEQSHVLLNYSSYMPWQ